MEHYQSEPGAQQQNIMGSARQRTKGSKHLLNVPQEAWRIITKDYIMKLQKKKLSKRVQAMYKAFCFMYCIFMYFCTTLNKLWQSFLIKL